MTFPGSVRTLQLRNCRGDVPYLYTGTLLEAPVKLDHACHKLRFQTPSIYCYHSRRRTVFYTIQALLHWRKTAID